MSTTPQSSRAIAQYNARILRPLADYIRGEFGASTLAEIAHAGQFEASELDGRSLWVGIDRIEAVLDAARGRLKTDDDFKRACVHRLAEAYGPMRYVMWATSPGAVYAAASRTYRLVTTNGDVTILSHSRTSMHARLHRPTPISRLHCLLQQAQTAALPTLWGLPPAMLREEACVALGDEACVYRLQWFDVKRWLPIGAGLGAGALTAWLLLSSHVTNGIGAVALTLLGLAAGLVFEQQRTATRNLRVSDETNGALKDLALEAADVRRELLDLHQRQRDWTRVLEEEMSERASAFQQVLDSVEELRRARDSTLRAFSHDLRNPLTVLRANIDLLKSSELDAETAEIVGDFEIAAEQIGRLLTELMNVVTTSMTARPMTPQRLEIATIADRLRRRTRALVYGRDIRTSVFRTREAPEAITTDALLFDRILDNILTNAAKCTQLGSIVVELDGTPTSLVIKVSDTGSGIAAEDIDRIFRPAAKRSANGYGVGLSVVVQLLAQVGGRLEVMSKLAHGTTFWIHFPIEMPAPIEAPRLEQEQRLEPYEKTLGKVLTIRRIKSA